MPVSERIVAERQRRYDQRMEAAKKVVPQGPYCYENTGKMVERTMDNGQVVKVPESRVCPYWKWRNDKPQQRNGYCRLLKAGDWQKDGTFLLWDSVKECGINSEDPDENEPDN